MHKVTYGLLKGSYWLTVGFLLLAIFQLLGLSGVISQYGHTLMLVREMCATGAVVMIVAILGSAILHERLN